MPLRRGSSPLARGTHLLVNLSAGEVGLIPARAGNTGTCERKAARIWAHPRSRGEHVVSLAGGAVDAGSSPLARGTHKSIESFLW